MTLVGGSFWVMLVGESFSMTLVGGSFRPTSIVANIAAPLYEQSRRSRQLGLGVM